MASNPKLILCPCDSGRTYRDCCAPLHKGAHASNAEALMRSRYSAYALLGLENYLLETWHPATRPQTLNLHEDQAIKWLGLKIVRTEINTTESTAVVEFIARYKVGSAKASRMHEVSQFERLDRWYYLNAIS
jgi:SEC-C motif domain protein